MTTQDIAKVLKALCQKPGMKTKYLSAEELIKQVNVNGPHPVS